MALPLLLRLLQHGEFQRTKSRISRKGVLAVVYYSMSFEMVDTGVGKGCVSETFWSFSSPS